MSHYTTGQFPSTDGTQLMYRAWSPASPPRAVVALVHGWSDHAGRYEGLANTLTEAGMTVYAMDLRGHGLSDGQRGHVNRFEAFRQDVYSFLRTLRHQYPAGPPLFLLGHSLGGLITMDYAIHFPDEPLQGVIASSPLLSQPSVSPVMVGLLRVLARLAPRLGVNPGTDADTLSRDPAVVAAYLADPLVHQKATPRFALEIETAQQFVLSHADGLQHPFLLLYGSEDRLVPPHITRDSFGNVGAANKTRHEYDGGYHELFNDIIKDDVIADLREWLEAHLT